LAQATKAQTILGQCPTSISGAMKTGFAAWLLAALVTAAAAHEARVTPIAKVIQLLEDMVAKGTAEKEAEAVRQAAFDQWCAGQTKVKNEEIATGTSSMEMLNADIGKCTAHIRQLSDRIYELEEDVGRWEKDQKSASDVRSKEKADYRATSADYQESLDALDQAITVLKKQNYNRPQAEDALLQVQKLGRVPVASKKALAAFLQQSQPDGLSYDNSDSEAHGYEFQSGGVIDMLEKLKDQFSTQKYDLDKDEMTAEHAYQGIMQQLTDNIENAKHEISKKETTRAATQESKAEAEGSLAQVTADRAEDQKYLGDMTAMCQTKQADFASRQKLRADELEAIQKAIEIMSSDAVSGSGDKHLPAMLQLRKKGAALVQLRNGNSNDQSPLQARIAAFLADRAQTYNSRSLEMIAQRVAADPFTKVKKMIKDMISKLMQEGTEETEHKGWCDTELSTNKLTRDAKTEDIQALTLTKEDLIATISQLSQDIADLTQGVKELDAAMAKSTEDRTASKAKNEETIADAKAAQIAVTQAMAVLKDFYAKSAQATAFAQQPAADAPETFDKPYTGLLPEGGNVVDFLEVILTDFSRLESDTATAEATEADEYKTFMFESEKDKALKLNEKGHKESSKTDKESALHSTEEELKMTQEQLDKAMDYYEKLKPTCVDSGISYEERVKRREEEIQSLQEALKILTGTDLA
jgi:6-pyruvoyl-tetrahydropterin synthase